MLGIRPEHMAVVAESEAIATLEADLVEALGADTLVHGHVGDAADADLTIRLPGSTRVSIGDRLPFSVAPEHFHVFDHETGRRAGL